MNVPTNLKYSNDHEWLKIDGDVAYVGITEYAVEQLGDIVFIDITSEGETLDEGDIFGTVEAVKTVSDLLMPIGGEVIEYNKALEEEPDLVNSDPYGKGWMIKIKYNDAAEADNLLNAEDYEGLTV